MSGGIVMDVEPFKTAKILFPHEDSIRQISFSASDRTAMEVLTYLIQRNGCELHGLNGFSVDESMFIACSGSDKNGPLSALSL